MNINEGPPPLSVTYGDLTSSSQFGFHHEKRNHRYQVLVDRKSNFDFMPLTTSICLLTSPRSQMDEASTKKLQPNLMKPNRSLSFTNDAWFQYEQESKRYGFASDCHQYKHWAFWLRTKARAEHENRLAASDWNYLCKQNLPKLSNP